METVAKFMIIFLVIGLMAVFGLSQDLGHFVDDVMPKGDDTDAEGK